MIIDKDEISWLNKNYPGLFIDNIDKNIIIKGDFKFRAVFDDSSGNYIINPNINNHYNYPIIEDKYKIEIHSPSDLSSFPIIKNTDSRLLNLSKNLGCDSRDLHVYSELITKNMLCVIGPFDAEKIKGKIALSDLINRSLVPFFYDSSYFEKYHLRPREHYGHGAWGVLENYYDIVNIDSDIDIDLEKSCIAKLKNDRKNWNIIKKFLISRDNIKGHISCFVCGKNEIRICHKKIFFALFRLHNNIKELNLYNNL